MFDIEGRGVSVVRVGGEREILEGEDCVDCADVADFVTSVEGEDCYDCYFGKVEHCGECLLIWDGDGLLIMVGKLFWDWMLRGKTLEEAKGFIVG